MEEVVVAVVPLALVLMQEIQDQVVMEDQELNSHQHLEIQHQLSIQVISTILLVVVEGELKIPPLLLELVVLAVVVLVVYMLPRPRMDLGAPEAVEEDLESETVDKVVPVSFS